LIRAAASPKRRGALAGALLLGLSAPGPAAEPPPRVRPGTLVRWPGEGLEWCAVGEKRFAPLEGACYYPVDLLRPAGPLELVRGRAGRRETASVRVGTFDYPIQALTLPRRMVELSPEDLERVNRENREMARLWPREGPRRFVLPLGRPLDPLPAGGRFGHRRIINGRPRSPHGGADYSAAEGTPVLAAADGTVAMVADQFFGGHAVFVDHGDGLFTMYMHMSRVDVAEGASVRRGEPVGAVGSTGRATGPHLHFGVRWRGARVDPALLLGDPRAIPTIE
jgi:murein DD-endopeptidase MepM/ murein hydrolase activator NlpD